MIKYGLYILILGFIVACSEELPDKPTPELVDSWNKINSSDLGKSIAIQEEIDIKLYLELHRDWKMTTTGSGLQYFIYEEGEGRAPIRKEIAEIEYAITLLDGTEGYKTNDNEYEEIVMDQSDIESGLQEALKLMKVGDRMKLIIPSHIGHGILGDMKKIPPLTTLVVDIHLLGIK